MTAATKQIGAAVLGIGRMGATHVQAAKDSQWIDKVIGYEPDAQRAEERGKELAIPATSDLNSILNDPDIGIVYIASPNEVHCELAIKSMRAGKAVLCEKPMGVTLAEAREMLQAEKETGQFLQIGLEARYSKIYIKVKEWIEQGLIGKPVSSHSDYYSSEGHCKGTWRSNSETTLIAEKLCHYLDLPRWWFQEEVSEVYSIAAPNVVTYFNHPDNHQITCRFNSGAVSTLTFIMHTAQTFDGDPLQDILAQQEDDGHRLTYLIYGDKGAIETDVFRRRVRRWEFTDSPEKLKSTLVDTITFPAEEDMEWFHNVHGQNIDVSRRVAEGLPPGMSASDAYESMKVVFAAELSESDRRIVRPSELD